MTMKYDAVAISTLSVDGHLLRLLDLLLDGLLTKKAFREPVAMFDDDDRVYNRAL